VTAVESASRLHSVPFGAGTWLSHSAPRRAEPDPATRRPTPPEQTHDAVCPSCRRPLDERAEGFRERASSSGLTRRETQVMELIGQGRTNKDIVRLLGLSANTVKSYIRTAYRRLDLESRSEAVLWANGVEVERS
jgi:DNA-binding CsgD family transcriptional regulator